MLWLFCMRVLLVSWNTAGAIFKRMSAEPIWSFVSFIFLLETTNFIQIMELILTCNLPPNEPNGCFLQTSLRMRRSALACKYLPIYRPLIGYMRPSPLQIRPPHVDPHGRQWRAERERADMRGDVTARSLLGTKTTTCVCKTYLLLCVSYTQNGVVWKQTRNKLI